MSDSLQHRKIFVGGLAITTSQATLTQYFSSFGKVEDCVLMHNKYTGKSRCFGFVIMKTVSSAQEIIA
jgi:RNA recognition motif-containing protein